MTDPVTDADVVVVGAGIVGAATARELVRRRPGTSVIVLDKEDGPARHQTGRNSGVVHSGLYYRPGSAKARLVARGRELLAEHCAAHGIVLDRCGKVVVATRTEELAALDELARRGAENGVATERIGPRGIAAHEPHVRGLAALFVPSAAITDYRAVTTSLLSELTDGGGAVRTGARVVGVTPRADGVEVRLEDGATVRARTMVNCAGLHSDRIARMAGARTSVSIVPFRGEYHELRPSAEGLVRNLVYPVPDPRWPFLGVHMTRMVHGGIHVGPNAVLAGGRESYHRSLVARDALAMARDPGLRRLALRYWRTGAQELVRSRSRRLLLRDVRRLVPGVVAEDLVPAPSGIRAQAVAADGQLLDDFEFAASPGAVHVINAPSPAATAALAIAEEIADRVG